MKRDEKTGIIYEKWVHPSSKCVLLLVHGLGAHSGRWESLASFLVANNISSYALELKGFGQTPELKGHIDSFDIYFQDILSLYNIIKTENAGKKVFILGESMGALISFLLAERAPALFNGLICISPAFKSKLKFSPHGYIKFVFFFVFNQRKQLKVPFDSKMCTRDAAYQEFLDKNEYEHRLATPKLLLNILLAQGRSKEVSGAVKTPTLFLIAGKEDSITDAKASEKVFERLAAKDKKIMRYPSMRHALSIELDREKVFKDILKWIEERI